MTNDTSNKRPLALIIEDDQEQADIFAQALERAEFEAEIIYDGTAALERLAAVTPALVVLDLQLPYVLGEDILATADPLRARLLREKSDLILIKPVSFFQLSELAARLHSLP